jgi:hypothetical protein
MKLVRKLLKFVLALARELSDESAYARHLQATGHAHSRSEWRRFSESRHRRKYENAKCC